ncbi:glycosyltransferase family 2 protein [Nocardioides deserti]|uniref:Glycosyltransferase family 2 protein n=1 Tax=Nocardioides deserti TaxID=1588644 RepID=A0ABR6U765_9ACTN|nr:glycosyltransferase family 2 protein [Nocardioides deserti]MBC2959988.1 glycosyltransferase family 2 protein [Nocardioides deserti]GGO75261.1 glycosyl transferase [Nocardioides deserti]
MTAPRSSTARPTHLPSVDVVVATHDRPELVRTAVDAVMSQDYPGVIRCLVVHDRCAPDTSLVHDGDRRSVEVLVNTRTPGLAGSRNTGILAGHGDLVAFCDDDDVWFEDKLTRQVELLGRTGASTSVTGIVVDYRDHHTTRIPRPEEMTVRALARHRVMAAHPSTVMVRRDALEGPIGLVDEDLPGSYAEDYDWILRAAAVGEVAVVEMGLVLVRWGSSQFARQWSVIVAALDHLLAKHTAFAEDPRALGRIYGQRAFALAASGDAGALAAAVRAVRTWPWERRSYLAGAIALHLLSADRVLDLANRRGHGI